MTDTQVFPIKQLNESLDILIQFWSVATSLCSLTWRGALPSSCCAGHGPLFKPCVGCWFFLVQGHRQALTQVAQTLRIKCLHISWVKAIQLHTTQVPPKEESSLQTSLTCNPTPLTCDPSGWLQVWAASPLAPGPCIPLALDESTPSVAGAYFWLKKSLWATRSTICLVTPLRKKEIELSVVWNPLHFLCPYPKRVNGEDF